MNQSVVVKQMLVAVVAWALTHVASLGEPGGGGAANARLSAGYKIDKAACTLLTDPARDICINVARAKLDAVRAGVEFGNAVARSPSTYEPLAGQIEWSTETVDGGVPARHKPARGMLAQECDTVVGDAAPSRCVVVRGGGGKS